MGGTGSVVHGRRSRNRAGETSLLKLYNRDRCIERLPDIELANDGHSKGKTAAGDDEERRHTVDDKLLAGSDRRAERARARDKAMVQMYNRCHADLGQALASLRRALRRCSINDTGWATVVAVSAALEQVGVSVDSGTVLKLADQGYDIHHHRDSSDQEAAASPETRLVHWPTIIDFLEDGLGHAESRAIPEKRLLRSNSPETETAVNKSKAPRLNGEQAVPKRAHNEESLPRAASCRENAGDTANPEMTPERNLGSGDGLANEGGGCRQSRIHTSSNGIMLVKQGLSNIVAGLRELERDGVGVSAPQIVDTMDSIRGILEVKGGVQCVREGDCRPTVDRKGTPDKETRQENPEGTTSGPGVPGEVLETVRRLDTESLVQAACTAGKRGDIAALRDLADSVDLRESDAFGRNALYYTSLCGHVQAAHFAVVHAYGGVEGIPEKERWECRKNALSDEMRHYLDTGISPTATPVRQVSKSDERRPVQAVPVRKTCSSPTMSVHSRRREEPVESAGRVKGGPVVINGDGASGGDAHHAATPAVATISIASLFGREKDEDY